MEIKDARDKSLNRNQDKWKHSKEDKNLFSANIFHSEGFNIFFNKMTTDSIVPELLFYLKKRT